MLPIPPEVQAEMDECIEKLAGYMMKYTEPEKLGDFETTEVELRDQIQEMVSPKIGEFFFLREGRKNQESSEK